MQPPVLLAEAELSRPLPSLASYDAERGLRYRTAFVLVRLHDSVIGGVPLSLAADGIGAGELAEAIWTALGPRIAAHVEADALAPVPSLPADGLAAVDAPPCRPDATIEARGAPLVSVVVATHRRGALGETLAGLARSCYPSFEVLVVDNGPSPVVRADLIAGLREQLDIHVVREARPGASLARNAGLQAARGEIVAFLDDDVAVDHAWLGALVRPFLVEERVACVTGLVLPSRLDTPAELWFEQYGGFGKGFEARRFDGAEQLSVDPIHPYAVGNYGTGGNMAFRREALYAIGGFDPTLGPGTPARGGEDLDAMLSVIFSPWSLRYEPDALVRHAHQPDLRGLRRQMWSYGIGLSALLTKRALTSTHERRLLLQRLPRGVAVLLGPHSSKNEGKGPDYPRSLTALELLGILAGPGAYLLSRRAARSAGGARGAHAVERRVP